MCDIDSSHIYIGKTKRTLSQRFKEHTNLDKPTGVGDHCRTTGHSVSMKKPKVLTHESNWHKRKVKGAILNKEPLPWTETRDTICLPSTTKLSHQNLRQHTWHQYVKKARSWRVETSYSSSTIKLQSKLNYTTINHSWSHEQYIQTSFFYFVCATHAIFMGNALSHNWFLVLFVPYFATQPSLFVMGDAMSHNCFFILLSHTLSQNLLYLYGWCPVT